MTEGRLLAGAGSCWLGATVGPIFETAFIETAFIETAFIEPLDSDSSLLAALASVAVLAGLVGSWLLAKRHLADGFGVVVVACAVAFLVSAAAGVRASRSYQPLPEGPVSGMAEVLTLPDVTARSSWRAELRIGGRWRIEAEAWGPAADALAQARPGDRLDITGRLVPVGDRPWLRTRHIVARAVVDRAIPAPDSPRTGMQRLVQAVQRRVEAGADRLDHGHRGLYLGLVLGDDRLQPTGQQLRFREAGLTHLLAVSGQNVAFVLAVARPLLLRLGPRLRFVTTLVLLVVFALATGLEPSVLRASAAAAVACWAAWSDRASTGLAVLSVAVSGLVVIDPFLVGSVGFRLSVAASLGILLLGPSVERRLPGPKLVAQPAAVTVSAQVAVSPVLGWHFGLPSLVALPANLAAGWAAGLVMPWGLTGGVVAGMLPGPLGRWLQLPAVGLVWWLDQVATWSARVPAPRPGGAQLAVMAVLVIALAAVKGRLRLGPMLALLLLLVASTPRPPVEPTSCGPGVAWFPAGAEASGSVLVVSSEARAWSLEDCRRRGIVHIDVLLATSSSRTVGEVTAAAIDVLSVGVTYAPPNHRIRGAFRVVEPVLINHGSGRLRVEPSVDRTDLVVTPVAATSSRP